MKIWAHRGCSYRFPENTLSSFREALEYEITGIELDIQLSKDGEIVVTRLDEETLRKVAEAGNGAYVHAGNDEFGLNPIIDDVRRMEDEEFGSVVFEEYDEQYMYFFGIAFALLVIEMLIGERRPKRKWFDQ